MTILPIVERELRVASRRPFTYRLRLRAALSAILVSGVTLLVCIGQPATRFGMSIFVGLATLSLIYCLLAGRVATADCLSEEKREGTLGLLFLTDLKGYDVVLGKLAATSLNGLYGILAIFPVMAVPMLMGGVSNNQLWSMVLVLLDTFFFSLAIGMFSSAICRDSRKAMGINFGLVFLFSLLLPGVAGVIAANHAKHVAYFQLCYASPFYPGFLCLFGPYLPPGVIPLRSEFWISLGVIHGLTWILLAFSAWIAPRSWQDRPAGSPRSWKSRLRVLWDDWNYGRRENRPAFRKRLLNVNAFYWLAARAKLKPLHTWAVLLFLASWWVWGRIHYGALWLDVTSDITIALMLTASLKLWIALEAAQRLSEAQRVGSLELILSTPLTVRDILRGQFLALRRQFLAPLVLVLIVQPVLLRMAEQSLPNPGPAVHGWWWASIVFLPIDMIALSWVAMGRSLTAKNFNQAIIGTMGVILILPWAAFWLVALLTQLWCFLTSSSGELPDWPYYLYWWIGFGLAADIFFALRARAALYRMREIAMKRYAASPPSLAVAALKQKRVAKNEINVPALSLLNEGIRSQPSSPRPRKSRFKRRLVYLFALVAIVSCAWAYFGWNSRPKYPPPVVVPLALSQGAPRIFPAYNGAFFLLSDGSLWRWGAAMNTSSIALIPTRIATNTDWKKFNPTQAGYGGVRSDGTLWKANADGKLKQIGDDKNWVDISDTGWTGVALKKDGTLWGWGNLSTLMGTNFQRIETNFVQLTTNTEIAAVRLRNNALLAIKRDGTLWAWGNTYLYGPVPRMINLPELTQVCSETNWIGFEPGWETPVRNTSNEVWLPLHNSPKADAPASFSCQLAFTNAVPNRCAIAFAGRAMQYEIRTDGTLWERSLDIPAWMMTPEKPIAWRRRGKRQDWISLWNNQATAFGLTSDGMIWTWGLDPNGGRRNDLRSKLQTLAARLKIIMAGPRSGPGALSAISYSLPAFDAEPRPVMQLKAP